MGNTFPLSGGGLDAVEGVFGDGRAPAVRRSAAGRRSDERGLSRVRHFAQDRLQDLRALQGTRSGGVDRRLAPAGSLRQPAAAEDREPDRHGQAHKAPWGRPQDPRAPGGPTGRRYRRSGQEHDPRRAPAARPGQGPGTAAAPGDRHAALDRRRAKRPLVRRFQEPAPAKAGGEFKLGNGRYCFPLTVTDHASRYLLLCEALESTRENLAITAFEQLFQERGLPQAVRSDNGVPFASPNGLFNLSKLSVWWLRLGIAIERIKPGHPQQNGRHERMHLTLKKEATRPPGMNSLQQQARFDDFVQEFNTEPPHEALAMKCPAEIYSASSRPYSGLPDLTYPLHDPRRPRHRLRPYLHASQARQHLNRARRSAPRHQGGRRRHLDRQFHALRSRLHRSRTENPATPRQPLRHRVVTHVLGTFRYLCLRSGQRLPGGGRRIRTLGPAATAELGAAGGRSYAAGDVAADARQQTFSFPGDISGHTESKNPVEFRPWSHEFDGKSKCEGHVMGQAPHHYLIFETAGGFCGIAWNNVGIKIGRAHV